MADDSNSSAALPPLTTQPSVAELGALSQVLEPSGSELLPSGELSSGELSSGELTSEPVRKVAKPQPPRAQDKLRIRFRKSGSLRLLSHHDLLRTFERMLRRSELPFHSTQGFNPHPRLVFALSLPLGVIGCAEVVELELARPVEPEEVLACLARQTPPGLTILEVRRIPVGSGAQVCGLTYRVPLPLERVAPVQQRIHEVLQAQQCWVERQRPPRRQLDIRPFLRNLRILPEALTLETTFSPGSVRPWLEMDLWLTRTGTARPEELLTLLGLGDLFQEGVSLERTRLELQDEQEQVPCEQNEQQRERSAHEGQTQGPDAQGLHSDFSSLEST